MRCHDIGVEQKKKGKRRLRRETETITTIMTFMVKQPSLLPRALCALQCPPHNLYHDIEDYPEYYNPLYFPAFYASLFASENSVCEWLLNEFRCHMLTCLSCPHLPSFLEREIDGCRFDGFFFHLTFQSVHFQFPLTFVEGQTFSFCTLQRRLVLSITKLHFSFENLNFVDNELLIYGKIGGIEIPVWIFRDRESYVLSLLALPVFQLRNVACISHSSHNKCDLIDLIVDDFLYQKCILWDILKCSSTSSVYCISDYFLKRYGEHVSRAFRDFRAIDDFKEDADVKMFDVSIDESEETWMNNSFDEMLTRMRPLSKTVLIGCLHAIPCHLRPQYSAQSAQSCRVPLLFHIRNRISYLFSLTNHEFFQVFYSVLPFYCDVLIARKHLIEQILEIEYGELIVSYLCTQRLSNQERCKQRRDLKKKADMEESVSKTNDLLSTWPKVVPTDVIFECLENYRLQSIWVPPLVCSVCGLLRQNVAEIALSDENVSGLDFSLLHVKDPYIENDNKFQYGINAINGAVLERKDFKKMDDVVKQLQICNECHQALIKKRVPRLSLANYMYRGELPEEFEDLTWIEEMVCAKYRNTAHIARIYGSSDPSQPKVFHGNTCAHEMNVLSTATVLPRTIADINDMLSVVFVGPQKFDPKLLGQMFTVRKKKIWHFLLWLTSNNRIYKNIQLDSMAMDSYPDNDILPGIEHRIFEDHDTNSTQLFSEETSGFAEHPAQLLHQNNENESPFLLMEKMGVSDADSIKISGRASTASALKNLISSGVPDLVLHRSSHAVVEYNNPDFLPGMFPTLFPMGLGGFENPLRNPKLSFETHANVLLDVPDKCFRHHYSYIFVVLNILQRRLSHLHTHFTVRKSNFESIATKITSLSPDILIRLANHLEHEGSLDALNADEQAAMTLLNHVNTISARIPGSQSAKIYTRNEIRSYFGEFGLPQLYFTFNPSVNHSPIFQVMVGDESVDLTARFPFLVPSKERAQRVVEDPVAAADFFQFCVDTLFEQLFGWDFDNRKSNEKGGILGHLRAFFGTCEFTERGSLHGHFLIWLLGGLNPKEIHKRLKEDSEFQSRFFAYFEDIIQHELPNIEIDVDPTYEPRIERPPPPPKFSSLLTEKDLQEWQSFMQNEVKQLGEILQRHKCKPVCHKYGNDNKCRFLFPHEVVSDSYFDTDTNSVVLKCLDSMVNYFNRYILVYCRHNHDLKCILSGKAAEAAMCYITDYITKMEMKTYQILSLLSRATASVPEEPEVSLRERGRQLLHKCLTQFTRQQQIHAQQAARYLRGYNDTISSHNTIPLMSGLLLDFISQEYRIQIDEDSECKEDKLERSFLKIQTDQAGNLVNHNQLTDYWFRDTTLSNMNFYEFVRCITLTKIRQWNNEDITNKKIFSNIQKKHKLLDNHPLRESHYLVEHTNEECGQTGKQFVPRIIGATIPREKTGLQWKIFILAHFKPFSFSDPLIRNGETIKNAFDNFEFSSRSQQIMKNWEDTHECEDKRDEERLRKRAALTTESIAMTNSLLLNQSDPTTEAVEDEIYPQALHKKSARNDFIVLQTIQVLQQSQWLLSPQFYSKSTCEIPTSNEFLTEISSEQLKNWIKSIKQQELILAQKRQNFQSTNIGALKNNTVDDTECNVLFEKNNHILSDYCRETFNENNIVNKDFPSPIEIIEKIGNEYHLQTEQWIAFQIISCEFLKKKIFKNNLQITEPLRMFLTGPGGTGKTHVVKAVQKVMEYYNAGHTIRFLAPTGSAASLIEGMTVHKGLGIKVHAPDKGKGNRKLGENHEDYNVSITIQNKVKLRNEWRLVEIVMIDECSLLSAELLSEIDAALRFAKEKPDEWFGGIIVIFAGDLYQYPPVCATPLYKPIPPYTKTSNNQISSRLGRLAWKSITKVVTFTKQKRMETDAEYANAVTHLRTRECIPEDIDLFNTRVIKSSTNENGIDMASDQNFNATAIVRTNLLRETMNLQKSQTNSSTYKLPLITCAANDACSTTTLNQDQYDQLLHLNMSSSKVKDSLPGFIPLYIGMPIILKSKNISTDLGITNGCQGYIRHMSTTKIASNYLHCTCAIVEFPNSKVRLPNLPDKHFPVVPIKNTFTTQLSSNNKEKIKLKITRTQLPIQPAFAVTGHSAQGLTFLTVLTNLSEGGFSAYVAASRAQSRHGLFITEPVTLADLNDKTLPFSLLQESKRLDALETNTYIHYGFRKGNPQKIPDPESERAVKDITITANFNTDIIEENSKEKKRKQL